MARNFSKLLDELDAMPHPITGEYSPIKRRNVGKTLAAAKVVRVRSTLAKSAPPTFLKDFFAEAQAAGGKVTIAETSAKAGKKKPAKTAPVERAEPREHTALRVARLLGEMKAHAMGSDLNGRVTEVQLKACHALARQGELKEEDVEAVRSALDDGRALPLYIIKKLGSGNT